MDASPKNSTALSPPFPVNEQSTSVRFLPLIASGTLSVNKHRVAVSDDSPFMRMAPPPSVGPF